MQEFPQNNYGPPPAPKKSVPAWVIVLAVIGGIVLLPVAGCVVCAGLGVVGAAKQASTNAERSSSSSRTPEQERTSAATVELQALLAEYKDNEIRADGKFKDQWIRTSGTVASVKKDILDSMYITVGTGKGFEIPVVQCTLTKSQESAASSLSKGQQVTISGRVEGLMMNVRVRDCQLE